MNYSHEKYILAILVLMVGCGSPAKSSEKERTLKTPGPPPIFRGIQVVEKSESANYFELPDALDDVDPETISTFKLKIKNLSLLSQIQSILKNGTFSYTPEKSKRCLPAYNAAIVYRKSGKKSTILFSFPCSILKVTEENIYLNFDKEKENIEKLFSDIRR